MDEVAKGFNKTKVYLIIEWQKGSRSGKWLKNPVSEWWNGQEYWSSPSPPPGWDAWKMLVHAGYPRVSPNIYQTPATNTGRFTLTTDHARSSIVIESPIIWIYLKIHLSLCQWWSRPIFSFLRFSYSSAQVIPSGKYSLDNWPSVQRRDSGAWQDQAILFISMRRTRHFNHSPLNAFDIYTGSWRTFHTSFKWTSIW